MFCIRAIYRATILSPVFHKRPLAREKRRFITHSRAIQVYVAQPLIPESVAIYLLASSPRSPVSSPSLVPSPATPSSFLRTNSGRSSRYDPSIGINEATIIKKRNFILSVRLPFYKILLCGIRGRGVGESLQKSGYFVATVRATFSNFSLFKAVLFSRRSVLLYP